MFTTSTVGYIHYCYRCIINVYVGLIIYRKQTNRTLWQFSEHGMTSLTFTSAQNRFNIYMYLVEGLAFYCSILDAKKVLINSFWQP